MKTCMLAVMFLIMAILVVTAAGSYIDRVQKTFSLSVAGAAQP